MTEFIDLSSYDFPKEHCWYLMPPKELHRLMEKAPFFWCLAGGLSLDFFAKQQWREHQDIDILVFRQDTKALMSYLMEKDWVFFAPNSTRDLVKINVPQPVSLNVKNLWCKPRKSKEWRLEVLLQEADAEQWFFPKNKTIHGLQKDFATKQTWEGESLLCIQPQIQLLYKATSRLFRKKDLLDWQKIFPLLEETNRFWLRQKLQLFPSIHSELQVFLENEKKQP